MSSENTRPFRRTVTVSGTGVAFASNNVLATHSQGTMTGFSIRQPVGGLATAYTANFATGGSTPTATPVDGDEVLQTASIASTASATDPDIDTGIELPKKHRNGLTVGLNITAATGAWSFEVTAWGTEH